MQDLLKKVAKKTEGSEFYNYIPEGYTPGKTKYIIITGSVISGVGKGTFSSCLGSMLRLFNSYEIVPLKFECYVNYDSGTLNPFRHGEVFVLDDGTETDLDLGTYERMLNKNLTKSSFVTMGKVFKTIIDKERAGDYLGRDVEFIPHVTGEIKNFARKLALKSKSDIVLIEIGGTVGEIQNSIYLEAMRELAYEEGRENVCFINVTYVLQPNSLGEQKSKAAQLGIKALMSIGIQPDIIVCRSENPITDKIKEKISIYSNVPVSRTIGFHDTRNIYKFPLTLKEKGIDCAIFDILNLKPGQPHSDIKDWKNLLTKIDSPKKQLTIGIAGKYTNVHDSYMSILKALEHTAPYSNASINIKWIETMDIETGKTSVEEAMKDIDGMIVPGGFGKRGAEGKIACIKYLRENNIPYLGLCFGFQMAVIEYARNVCNIQEANSTEIEPDCKDPVIDILPEQKEIEGLGGNMRLGSYPAILTKGSKIFSLYNQEKIDERHRHRYEVNNKYLEILEKNGLIFSGKSPKGSLMEFLELPNHKFFIGTQAHPCFKSKPTSPSPVFHGFIKAALEHSN
ncbi:MAG: CTP synthase (glutamine hydrolyzing) [Candidatus Woesearchaeota archaeon]|jgi:CTP synthase|nr:CTP synthase (glutamine hydrolyzing) [Candidatus Woesearchaeota archaeon]MDP7610302.1 CTP synthase (glutamine hydrolyzing) [Candidatus Woesearchaeota archaeon]|tara:strand:- start:5481 stop:7181 length:1701 start_codon:yes stop_codon:yes gene_type:complete